MSKTIIFDDLAAPQFTWQQRAILSLADQREVQLEMYPILKAASDSTGLNDFGPDDFKQRMAVLLEDYNSDDEMTNVGRGQMYEDLLRCARNRLLIQERLNRTPDIDQLALAPPLSVSGLPRSGTTHLVNLLAADTRFQSLPLWRIQEPFHVSGQEQATVGLKFKAWLMRTLLGSSDTAHRDPRYLRCSLRWSGMQIMAPNLAAMHPMNPDHIHEELELMTYDFASNQFEWTAVVPKYRDFYLASDQTPHYEYLLRVLKLLSLQEGSGRAFVLKCVQNPEQLPALKHILPDATAILTHRDPVAVIQSTATMIAYGHRILRSKVDPRAVLDYWTERFEKLLRACVRDREVWPAEQSLDIMFHEFMADQQGTIERIYEHHGQRHPDMQLTAAARQQMDDFIANHPRGKYGRVKYKLKEYFGVDADQLRQRFDFYFDAFPVQPEL
ncbi:MAG: sulfotransferase [Gammaproteobacteria bacterium]|nr:sulfotransferase [Gammaproteobacteria bacterium]